MCDYYIIRSSASVEDPPTFQGRGEEGEHGKEYWIRRATEVCVCVCVCGGGGGGGGGLWSH